MSRAAQEMQRIADEMRKARRQPTKKGRQAVDYDKLEDVTQGEAHDEHRATGDAAPPAADALPAAAAEEQDMAAETPSAIRSRKWRENQKKKNGGAAPRKAKAAKAKRPRAAAANGEGKTIVKTKGEKKWSFVSTSTEIARRAFGALLTEVKANPEAPENAGLAERLPKIVARLEA